MQIHLSRDSVCAGDDGDAPHAHTLALAGGLSPMALFSLIAEARYLASITGGRATWSAVTRAGQPLAVIAQQWTVPKLLPDCAAHMSAAAAPDGSLTLHLRYHCQEDPEAVYAALVVGA